MCADHDDLGIGALLFRLDRDLNVTHRFAADPKFLAADGIAHRCERHLDIASNLLEFVVMGEVVLAPGNGRDVTCNGLGQRRLLARERRQRAVMRLARHGGHVVQRRVAGRHETENGAKKNYAQGSAFDPFGHQSPVRGSYLDRPRVLGVPPPQPFGVAASLAALLVLSPSSFACSVNACIWRRMYSACSRNTSCMSFARTRSWANSNAVAMFCSAKVIAFSVTSLAPLRVVSA